MKTGNDDLGGFEKHTTGYGSKLMVKMGYEPGGGLGKHRQGIVAPIEAELRPRNMGIGFNQAIPTISEHQEVEIQANSSRGRRRRSFADPPIEIRSNPNRRRRRMDNVAAEELIPKTITKVLDMRGPEVRVLSSLENLNAELEFRENNRPFSELRYNVELLEAFAGIDKQKLDRELRTEAETVVVMHNHKEKLRNDLSRLQQQLDSMDRLSTVLDEVQVEGQTIQGAMTTLDNLAKSLVDIRMLYTTEEAYKLGNLLHIAHSYVVPLFIVVFDGWDPLENCLHGQELVSVWRSLLSDEGEGSYVQLLMKVVFHAVLSTGWEAREPEPMIRFLESWQKLLPGVVVENILDRVVMPGISFGVDSWNPRAETIPIHQWIHPWLPWFGSHKLEPLYCNIRNRLERVLDEWHPSDESAYFVLSPWKSVFDAVSWERMIVRCILPKLLNVMHGFEINPRNQMLEQFFWVMRWAGVLPVLHMVSLMNIFFNKWLDVLYNCLCANPNFAEVGNWFSGWKDVLPDDEHVQYRLSLGLEMINQAVEGIEIVRPMRLEENGVRYFRVNEQQRQFERAAAAVQAEAEDVEMSFRDVIEVHAQQNELVFKPKPGRTTQEGHQIYSFGKISIVIDFRDQKVFAQKDEKWSLVSLQELLELHNRACIRRQRR